VPGYRLESLLLHAGNAVLLFLLFSAFCSSRAALSNERAVVLAGTFLFFVHPRSVESVCIVANQTGLLCTFFSLLSLLFWTRILAGSRRLASWYIASLFSLLLAMLSKESAYVFPFLHGLLFLLFSGKRDRKTFWLLSGYFVVIAVPLALRHHWLEGPSIATTFLKEFSTQGSLFSYLGAVLALLLHQLDQWFFPVDIKLFQYPFFPEGLTFREVALPLLVCSGFVWLLRRDKKLLLFGFGLFFIAYLPSSNLIPVGRMPGGGLKAGAHHLYLAQAGLALLVGSVMFRPDGKGLDRRMHARRRLISGLLFTILVLFLCHQTFQFSGHYQNADRFYRGVLERNPVYAAAWQNYAWYKLYVENKPDDAEEVLLDGLEVVVAEEDRLGQRKLVWNLLHLYLEHDRCEEAETLLQCIRDKWIEDPVGNHYLWTLVQRLEERKEEGTSE
jgi:hypothetical protein